MRSSVWRVGLLTPHTLYEMTVKAASEVGCGGEDCADGSRSVSEASVQVDVSLIVDSAHLEAV